MVLRPFGRWTGCDASLLPLSRFPEAPAGRGVLEQIVDHEIELVRDRVQRAHRRHDVSPLDLRHQAWRDTDVPGEAANGETLALARLPQPGTQIVRDAAETQRAARARLEAHDLKLYTPQLRRRAPSANRSLI
jgi:hypothetical protein